MNIEVKVSDVNLATIVDRDYDGAPTTLGDLVAEKLVRAAAGDDSWPTLRDRITQIRDEKIHALLEPLIAEAFSEPIQRTTNYGSPLGEPVTLREVVIAETQKVLAGWTTNYSLDRGEPLGQALIRQMIHKELRTELSGVIKDERQKVVDAVRGAAADLITEAVTKGVTGK